MSPTETVLAMFRSYLEQDREAAERLIDDAFVFTSPYDDHIDRTAFFDRCFPTADRFVAHEMHHVVPAGEADVFVMYEYELHSGARHRNVELMTVRDGRIVETQVFFGGAVR
jgi:ketosteroid isomerase-like protein